MIGNDPELHAKVEELMAGNVVRGKRATGTIDKHGVFTGRYALNPFPAAMERVRSTYRRDEKARTDGRNRRRERPKATPPAFLSGSQTMY